MVGLTLLTVTAIESLSDAPSESLTVTLTVGLAGPSGKEQTKLPAPVAVSNVSAPTWLPPVPQVVSSRTNVSPASGSETVNRYACWVPSATDVALPPSNVTVGASLTFVTVTVNTFSTDRLPWSVDR